MKSDIHKYIRECDVCQRNKVENNHLAGLLQPLLIPTKIWTEVCLDFFEGLPNSPGRNVIMVVVDRLSKYAHFIPLTHPNTVVSIAKLFLVHVFRLRGLPKSIVSDRDRVFTSNLWREFFPSEWH